MTDINSDADSENQSLLKIETLEKDYSNTLVQYQQEYTNYINLLTSDEKTGVSNYDQVIGSGGNCTGSTGWFPDGMWQKDPGNYPSDQCAALCDENPYCAGYNLLGPNDANGNPSCSIFADVGAYTQNNNNGLGCYKKKSFTAPTTTTVNTTSLKILGVGVDGLDYVKNSPSDPWQRLNNDTGGDLVSCAINPANGMYFVVNKSNLGAYKNSYTDYSFTGLPNSCCYTDLAISPDGQYGVITATDGKLWSGTMTALMNQTGFTPVTNPNGTIYENIISLAISPDGMVYGVGTDYQIYTKPSYLGLQTENWTGPQANSCCVTSITFAPDGTFIGIGTDGKLYSKSPGNNYEGAWTPDMNVENDPIKVKSIATLNTSSSTTSTNIPTQVQASNNNALAEFTSSQGRNFWGASALNEGPAASLEDCETMCASDINCSGATYQGDKNYCYTRTGEGELVSGEENDYALIPQIRSSLMILQNLNTQLLNLNTQIESEMTSLYPIAKADLAAKNEKQRELNQWYLQLLEEQALIAEKLGEYETLEQEYDNNSLMVNQQNLLLKFWSIFAIVVLAILFKVIFKVQGTSFIFLFLTVLLILIFLSLDWWSLIPIILLPLLFKMIYFPSS